MKLFRGDNIEDMKSLRNIPLPKPGRPAPGVIVIVPFWATEVVRLEKDEAWEIVAVRFRVWVLDVELMGNLLVVETRVKLVTFVFSIK